MKSTPLSSPSIIASSSTSRGVIPSIMAAFNLHFNGDPKVRNRRVSNPHRPLLCHAPVVIKMSRDDSYCASITAEIEAHLKQTIPLKPSFSVFEPMHHFVFSAPRNTAPALCVAACELVGGDRNQAIAAASALQLMHASAFTHEQLPLTDRPKPKPKSESESKPKPTAHHVYNPNIELLIPDAMVPFGFELLARSDDQAQNNSDRILRVLVEISRAIGSQGMVDGQYQEFLILHSDDVNDAKNINYMCQKKEGRLHACAAACGAILGGANEEEIEKLRSFGLCVGTIQGISSRVQTKEGELERMVEEYKNLALKELEHFEEGKLEAISSFLVGI